MKPGRSSKPPNTLNFENHINAGVALPFTFLLGKLEAYSVFTYHVFTGAYLIKSINWCALINAYQFMNDIIKN